MSATAAVPIACEDSTADAQQPAFAAGTAKTSMNEARTTKRMIIHLSDEAVMLQTLTAAADNLFPIILARAIAIDQR